MDNYRSNSFMNMDAKILQILEIKQCIKDTSYS